MKRKELAIPEGLQKCLIVSDHPSALKLYDWLAESYPEMDLALANTINAEGDYDGIFLVNVPLEEYRSLPLKGKTVFRMTAIDAEGLTDAQHELSHTDWRILRDLERKFLTDHPLHTEREQWRKQVDEEIAAENPDAEQ